MQPRISLRDLGRLGNPPFLSINFDSVITGSFRHLKHYVELPVDTREPCVWSASGQQAMFDLIA
jgi:hypothetical protein